MSNEPADRIARFLGEVPKAELHLHIEGAFPPETLFQLIQRDGNEPSIKTLEDLSARMNYTSFPEFLDIWRWKGTFFREEGDFEELAYQVMKNLSAQNVKYVEAFYSPCEYLEHGLTISQVTGSLIAGKERARSEFGIKSELIVDIVRDFSIENGMKVVEEVTPFLGKGVIGIGMGGNESSFPAEAFSDIYREAGRRGFRLVVHAGEGRGADSVWEAIKALEPERIGHGVRAGEDPDLVSFLAEKQIPLEMCVTSNVETGVCPSVEEHPIAEYFRKGLMITVNSDDPTMFHTTITREYELLVKKLGFSLEDLKIVSLNSIDASFMSENDKAKMKLQFDEEWEHLLDRYDFVRKSG